MELLLSTRQQIGACLALQFPYRPDCRIDIYEDSRRETKEWEEVLAFAKDKREVTNIQDSLTHLGVRVPEDGREVTGIQEDLGTIKGETHLVNIKAETHRCPDYSANSYLFFTLLEAELQPDLLAGFVSTKVMTSVFIINPAIDAGFLYHPGFRFNIYEDSRQEAKEWEEVLVFAKDVSN